MQKRFEVKNRKGLTIRGIIEWKKKQIGPLIILCHGLKASMDQPQIKETAKALIKAGYAVVSFDATNNVGKSQGNFINFTTGGYIQDAKRVVTYALQTTKQKEYIFVGFSIGAMASYIIASKDRRTKKLVIQAPVYNLKKILTRPYYNFPLWLKQGWIMLHSNYLNKDFKLGIKIYQEGIKYKVNQYLKKIKCPVLVIYGSKEDSESKKDFRKLFKVLQSEKRKIVLPDTLHTLKTKRQINVFTDQIIKWLRK